MIDHLVVEASKKELSLWQKCKERLDTFALILDYDPEEDRLAAANALRNELDQLKAKVDSLERRYETVA